MAEADRSDFLHYYQHILLGDSGNDPFNTASIRRKCLALAFQASLRWSNNELSVAVLEENLKSYASLIDARSAGDVDNYSASSLALAFNSKSECSEWISSLKEPIPLPEALKSKLECECNKVTNEDVKRLLDAKKTKVTTDVRRELKSVAKSVPSVSFDLGETFISEGNKTVPLKWQKNFTPKQGGCGFSRPLVPDVQVYRYSGDVDNTQKNSVPSWQKCPSTNEIRITRADVKQPISSGSAPRNNPGPFRTAKEELGIQNQKKWAQGGQNGGSNGRRLPYRSQKHLGTSRRPPVHDDFVLPLRQEPGQENQPPSSRGQTDFPEMDEDERLKGIDPKMIEMIKNEIIDNGTPVDWDDIAGLDFAKATIQEIVVWPLLRPDIFFGLRGPPKGILLFGPPGTGKTLIGKCIASQSKSTFFSISASSLTSKWIGEGEKMVRALFAVARCHPPAVIFIDEIDSLLSQRNETDHESSRRIKTEFLVQLDGAATAEEERILVIGATNRPQELDEAARRRLVKRLYIPLPEFKARRQIVVKLMSNQRNELSSGDVDEVAELTDGYSGADMKNLCREAALGPIRSIKFEDMEHIQPDQVRPVVLSDFKAALSQVRASVSSKDLDQYITWNKQYGCAEAK